MKTAWQTNHKHSISGKPTTSAGGHSHELDEVEAALAKLEAQMGDVVLRITKLEAPPVTPPAPPPVEPPPTTEPGVVYTFGPSVTGAQLLAKMRDMTIDAIELTAGTYTSIGSPFWVDTVDRSSRPLTIRPAAGATVTISGGTRPWYFGYSGKVSYVTVQGLTFSGQDFSATDDGIIWTGWVDHVAFNNITITNVLGAHLYFSWVMYISAAPSPAQRGQYITCNDWVVDGHIGGARGIGGLTMGHSPSPINITARRWTITGCKYAWYMNPDSDGGIAKNVVLSDWTISDCGYNSGVLCTCVGQYVDGSYQNVHATGCSGNPQFYQQGPPYLTDLGGNTWG